MAVAAIDHRGLVAMTLFRLGQHREVVVSDLYQESLIACDEPAVQGVVDTCYRCTRCQRRPLLLKLIVCFRSHQDSYAIALSAADVRMPLSKSCSLDCAPLYLVIFTMHLVQLLKPNCCIVRHQALEVDSAGGRGREFRWAG